MNKTHIKKLYVITGFLGAGKTTLMQELINLFSDKKLAVIVNEFGQKGIDGTLLSREGIEISEINNGSIFCVCRKDLFVEALVKAQKLDVDILLVETSGLSDPSGMNEMLDIVKKLTEENYDYRGTIAVVDASNILQLMDTAIAVKQQIVSSHFILINKIDLVEGEKLQHIEEALRSLNSKAVIRRTTFSKIENSIWPDLINTSNAMDVSTLVKRKIIGSQKILIKMNKTYSKKDIERWISDFYQDIYRIKGFINLGEGWHYVDGTGEEISISPIHISQNESFLVVLGSGQVTIKEIIKKSWSKYFKEVLEIS